MQSSECNKSAAVVRRELLGQSRHMALAGASKEDTKQKLGGKRPRIKGLNTKQEKKLPQINVHMCSPM